MSARVKVNIIKMKNTVDLSKLKAEDTIKFRCGISTAIKNITDGDDCYLISLDDVSDHVRYWEEGFLKIDDGNGHLDKHPFDIIEIIPVSFNLDDVKPGMAFSVKPGFDSPEWNGYFIGFADMKPVFCTTSKKTPYLKYCTWSKELLIRSPEHDIEVKK